MVYGVTRKSGRGIPKCILQEEVKTKDELARVRGTLKVAKLVGDEKLQGLVAVSLYDTKPVYVLTNAIEQVKWIQKDRQLYDKTQNKKAPPPFYRINIIISYNYNMNNVDIADQLRGSYRWDHWMRKRKWWWSMYFWCIQMLLTNCYVLYKKYMILHNKKPLSQYLFKYRICMCWLHERYRPQLGRRGRGQESSARVDSVVTAPTVDDLSEITVCTRSTRKASPTRATRFTDKTLHPTEGSLKMRLDHTIQHWPLLKNADDSRCQMHAWATRGDKYRCNIVYCKVCNVHLCLQCYTAFHCIYDLVAVKESFCLSYGGSVIVEDDSDKTSNQRQKR